MVNGHNQAMSSPRLQMSFKTTPTPSVQALRHPLYRLPSSRRHPPTALAWFGRVRPSRSNRLCNAAWQAPCSTPHQHCSQGHSSIRAAAHGSPDGLGSYRLPQLLAVWTLSSARGWRVLTGLGYHAGSLKLDQIARVQHFMAIDAGMRTIRGDTVGRWMVTGSGSAVTFGTAPVDFFTWAGRIS